MDPQRSPFEQPALHAAPSRYERLRLGGRTRSAIIAYGIGAYTVFVPHAAGPAGSTAANIAVEITSMLFTATALQLLVFVVRAIAAAYERVTEKELPLGPLAMYVFELLVDGATVLLFALATYRGVAQLAAGLD